MSFQKVFSPFLSATPPRKKKKDSSAVSFFLPYRLHFCNRLIKRGR